ncbi:MAG: peptidoglycan DD-metalloendopeptidase family protein [bacterium]
MMNARHRVRLAVRRAGLLALLASAGCAHLSSQSPRYGRARPRPAASVPAGVPAPKVQARGDLPWPVKGEVIALFGSKADPKYGTRTVNRGIDIKVQWGSTVTAVDSGLVSFADRFMGYGNTVIVEHGGRRHSVYAGLAEVQVRVGERLERGQRIGASADTLHFEFRVSGKSADPLLFLLPR